MLPHECLLRPVVTMGMCGLSLENNLRSTGIIQTLILKWVMINNSSSLVSSKIRNIKRDSNSEGTQKTTPHIHTHHPATAPSSQNPPQIFTAGALTPFRSEFKYLLRGFPSTSLCTTLVLSQHLSLLNLIHLPAFIRSPLVCQRKDVPCVASSASPAPSRGPGDGDAKRSLDRVKLHLSSKMPGRSAPLNRLT